jgi:hypothetical protein
MSVSIQIHSLLAMLGDNVLETWADPVVTPPTTTSIHASAKRHNKQRLTRILQALLSCSGRMTMCVTPWCRCSVTVAPCRIKCSLRAPITTSCTWASASLPARAPQGPVVLLPVCLAFSGLVCVEPPATRAFIGLIPVELLLAAPRPDADAEPEECPVRTLATLAAS